ncbi:hypothetical protein [Pedobacter panaciterrae]
MNIYSNYKNGMSCLLTMTFILMSITCFARAESPKEDDYFKIMKVSAPEGAILEVGGLCTLPNGDLGVTTRRGMFLS